MKYLLAAIVLPLAACAAGNDDPAASSTSGNGGAGGAVTSAGGSASDGGAGGANTSAGGAGGGFMVGAGGSYEGPAEVYGHSKETLYRLDPETKNVGTVASFSGCGTSNIIFDIALDAESNLYGTNEEGLYAIDKSTAACTLINGGVYPNSLSFVPKGTLDADQEALVGFVDDQYVRIDPTTGAMSNVGAPWNNGFISSGDVVSVKNGPTYLTIKDKPPSTGQCADCLVEINPTTGAIVKSYPGLGFAKVFGTAFWAGKVYGFTNAGEIFEITISGTTLTTALVPTPMGLSFWGAGSTTSAPPTPQ
jgi:hypothetical protein